MTKICEFLLILLRLNRLPKPKVEVRDDEMVPVCTGKMESMFSSSTNMMYPLYPCEFLRPVKFAEMHNA